ncbi:MAG TPA: hypothetical protein PLQ35_12435 [bacterium]|nr:hypothetical protein [bacterium]HQL63094.1 hypothetical protein [bacterium]
MAQSRTTDSSPEPTDSRSLSPKIPDSFTFWIVLLGTAWFCFVVIHFLFLNPTFSVPLWLYVPRSLLDVASAPGPFLSGLLTVLYTALIHSPFLLLFGVTGWIYLFRRLRPKMDFPSISLAILLGIAIIGIPLHVLGSLHVLGRWPTLVTSAVIILVLLRLPRRDPVPDPPNECSAPTDRGIVYYISWGLTWIITVFMFYHSLGFPVDYWDALIYYVDYAQRTWEEGGFPTIVCGQVGIGLGANYPHLFHVLEVVAAHLSGRWSDLYGQLLPPVFGVLTVGLLAGLLRNLFGNATVTALGVLFFRAVPYGFSYQIWVSDYSLVLAATAGVFYCLERFLSTRDRRWYEVTAVLCAAMPTINYLGWIYFVLLALAPFLRCSELSNPIPVIRRFAPLFLVSFLLAVPWYIRNVLVTGNPVYAFFHQILDGKYIDPDVMASCNREWAANGDGPILFGDNIIQRLINTPYYFLHDNYSWKFGPLFSGLFLPGFLLSLRNANRRPVFLLMILFSLLLFIYLYFISGLYFYHTLGILSVFACCGALLVHHSGGRVRGVLVAGTFAAALCPGIADVLMGPKFAVPSLPALRYGPMDPPSYYRIKFRDEYPVWSFINRELAPDSKILTHENRYHLFRRDLHFVHLDDWEISRLYGRPFDEIHRRLNERGVGYYLRIRNEKNHPILACLGHRDYLNNPAYFQEMVRSGETVLYRIVPPATPVRSARFSMPLFSTCLPSVEGSNFQEDLLMIPVVRIGPGKSLEPSVAIKHGDLRINAVSQVDTVIEMFGACEDDVGGGEKAGVQVYPAPAVRRGKLGFEAVREMFRLGQQVRENQVLE